MPTIRKRGNSYQIRVSCGYDTKGNHKEQSMTWKPEEGMTEKQIKKQLDRIAVKFENDCMNGYLTATIKFQDFAEQWFKEYAQAETTDSALLSQYGKTCLQCYRSYAA